MQNTNIPNKYFSLFLPKVSSACHGEKSLVNTTKEHTAVCCALLNCCFNMLCFTAILAGDEL
jgi:hypothetical protein